MPILRFTLAQATGWLLVIGLLKLGAPLSGLALALAQGGIAAASARVLRAERWWMGIHLVFAPMVWLASQLHIPPGWYLAGFVLLAVFYWTSFRTRVPLFLSNRKTVSAIADLLPERCIQFLDAGAGTGSALRPLARQRPESLFVGIEAAPGPWLIGRLLAHGLANLVWCRGDFWAHDWAVYDVVYVFLSPVPMTRVWEKARREMRPDSLLISNSFPIDDVAPTRTIPPEASGGRPLYVYAPGRTPADKAHKKG